MSWSMLPARIDELPLPKDYTGEKIRVTYHDPCHLVRAQGVSAAPREILKALPQVEYVEMEEANTCCGGGGSFQFDFPEVSKGITEKRSSASARRAPVSLPRDARDAERRSAETWTNRIGSPSFIPCSLLDMALSGKGFDKFDS